MKKIFYFSPFFILLFACAGVGKMDRVGTGTAVNLDHKNYRVIKQAARGKDTGFWLLFIPIIPPTYGDAMKDLYSKVNVEGKATALTNVNQDHSNLFLILVSFPRITITADVIEFLDE